MGRKSNETSIPEVGNKEVKINYPGFSMCDNQIPDELANAKVGDMCRLEIIVKKVGDDIDTYDDNKPRVQVEIHKLGFLAKAGKLKFDEYDKLDEEGKKKYDEEHLEEEKAEENGQS